MSKVQRFFKDGDIFIWFTGFGLAMTLVMIAGLLILIFLKGSGYFYPSEIKSIYTKSGEVFLGEISAHEVFKELSTEDSTEIEFERVKVKIANREIYGLDFRWFELRDIDSITAPKEAVVLERTEFGNFHGFISGIELDGERYSVNSSDKRIDEYLEYSSGLRDEISEIEKSEIGDLNYEIQSLKDEIRNVEYAGIDDGAKAKIKEIKSEIVKKEAQFAMIEKRVDSLRTLSERAKLVLLTADGSEKSVPFEKIIRIYQPNQMGLFGETSFVISKIFEFLFDEPRESNTEGGVFPAIFGTVLMVLLMSLAAVPFGVIAALYLREYAKQGALVRLVRIAVNNLAGVPSIVFGVFGLGFFIYFVGGTIDQLFFPERLPTPTWGTGGILWASLTLALLTVPVVIVSTEEALANIPRGVREAALALGSTKWQMIRRVVLPASMPGILTGVILAMARGAGEVAPLMITGVVKLAPNLPFDWTFPFFHLDRKFMHLGFHLYDVGFQSPNVEAALPMVYVTTLLLIILVVLLNISAMIIRSRLREKYKSATF